MKPKLKEQAIALRKEGKSYKEIMELVPVSKSSLSLWLRDVKLTKKQQSRLSSIRGASGGEAKKKIWEEKRQKVMDEYDPPLNDPDFVLGLGLYWGEGTKWSRTETVFTNSDVIMMKAFTIWVNKFFAEDFDRFSVDVHHYDVERDGDIKAYWSEMLGIDLSNFIKSQVKVSQSSQKKKGNILPYGTAKVYVRGKGGWKVRVKIQKALECIMSRWSSG